MLRKPVKRTAVASTEDILPSLSIDEDVETRPMAPLGSKKKKKNTKDGKLKSLQEQVFGGEIEVMEEVDRILNRSSGTTVPKKKKKEPAWHDEDDDHGIVQVDKADRFKSLRRGKESKVPKSELTQRLKSQFEKVTSTPDWAKLPSERKKKPDEEPEIDALLKMTGNFLAPSTTLPQGLIDIKQCTDVNKEYQYKSKITALEFHPSAQVALTGEQGTLALFQVDGKYNPKIQSIYLENFPVTSAHFTQDGEQIVMGSIHKSFKYFDMIAGKVVNVPLKGLEEKSTSKFEVSPDGKYLVFLGNYGRMNFISTKAKEWLFTLTMNGNVKSVSFSPDGTYMYAFGDDCEVYVYDITKRECIHKFYDEGCTMGTCIAVSKNNQYIACGSNTGVVNLYERETCLNSSEPKPLKAIMNLTSACNMLKFNATSEILGIGTSSQERGVKLVHTSSRTTFSNYPEAVDINFRLPTMVDFSVNSGYFTIGTNKGKALLYRLQHYENY